MEVWMGKLWWLVTQALWRFEWQTSLEKNKKHWEDHQSTWEILQHASARHVSLPEATPQKIELGHLPKPGPCHQTGWGIWDEIEGWHAERVCKWMMWPTMLMSSLDGQGSVLSSRKLLHRLCDEQVASHHRVSIHSHETSSSFIFHFSYYKTMSQETDGVCWGSSRHIFLRNPHPLFIGCIPIFCRCEFVLLKTKTLMVESCQFHSSWWSHHHFSSFFMITGSSVMFNPVVSLVKSPSVVGEIHISVVRGLCPRPLRRSLTSATMGWSWATRPPVLHCGMLRSRQRGCGLCGWVKCLFTSQWLDG